MTLKGAAEKLRLSLDTAGVESDVKEFPDGRHGFINRITVASPLTALMKVTGIGYDHGSAAEAKRRILAFFDEHLRAQQAAARNAVGTGPEAG